jgi:hypothetical protein
MCGNLHPYEEDKVNEKQTRPSQRALYERYTQGEGGPKQTFKAFIKKEPYKNCADPRIITPVDVDTKMRYLRFVHSFCDTIAKQLRWYASGMKPAEIARRVARICLRAKSVTPSDYSRFDGHVQPIVRLVVKAVLTRAFAPEHHNELMALYKSIVRRPATLNGVRYNVGYCQSSGSPDTSLAATLENAFMHYITFREQGMTPKEAYQALGVYLGDDGLTADISVVALAKVSSRCGHSLKADPIARGQAGVNFLARYYGPGVWNGDPTSCIDIARQLKKFHVTSKVDVDATVKLREKCISFYFTDRHTPVFATIVDAAIRLGLLNEGDLDPEHDEHRLRSWSSKAPAESQYPNEEQEWMWDLLEEQLPGFDFDELEGALADCKKPSDMLGLPLCWDPRLPESKSYPMVAGEEDIEPSDPVENVEDLKGQVEDLERKRKEMESKEAANKQANLNAAANEAVNKDASPGNKEAAEKKKKKTRRGKKKKKNKQITVDKKTQGASKKANHDPKDRKKPGGNVKTRLRWAKQGNTPNANKASSPHGGRGAPVRPQGPRPSKNKTRTRNAKPKAEKTPSKAQAKLKRN